MSALVPIYLLLFNFIEATPDYTMPFRGVPIGYASFDTDFSNQPNKITMTRQEIYDAIIAACNVQGKIYTVGEGDLGTVIYTTTSGYIKQLTVDAELNITFLSYKRTNPQNKQYAYAGMLLSFHPIDDPSQILDISEIVSEL